MGRYPYLRDAQKQLKITNYVWNKSFIEFYLVYNGDFFEISRIIIMEVRRFCNSMY